MKKRLFFWIKIAVLLAVGIFVTVKLRQAWLNVQGKKIAIEWRWGWIAAAGFAASMLTSSLVWRWLAQKMGTSHEGARRDGLPTVPLLGAYTFSQLGKYIPGKLGLLVMRIERCNRFGMKASICTMSTLLENALYLLSGGLAGMLAIGRILDELRAEGWINAFQQQWQWPLTGAAMAVLAAGCHPRVFYGAINWALRRAKRPEIPRRQQLGMLTLAMAILGFMPCWLFGGVALWASTRCVQAVDPRDCVWFAGAFALSVIIGMATLMPGGIGFRELVLGAAVTLQMPPAMPRDQALLVGGAAAVLQRLFQVVAEIGLGAAGAVVSGRSGRMPEEPNQANLAQESRR